MKKGDEFLAVSRKISFPDDFSPLLPRLIKGILAFKMTE